MKDFFTKSFLRFLITFLIIFALCYFGTLAIIGLAAPGGYHISFVEKYLDYISLIKNTLMGGVKYCLSIFGYQTVIEKNDLIRIINGRGVYIAMDCVGFGVYSFWIAFVLACKTKLLNKVIWTIAGVLLLWLINIIRISFFLVTLNKGTQMPLGIDHHTWFNILAYVAIFIMIFFFDKSISKENYQ